MIDMRPTKKAPMPSIEKPSVEPQRVIPGNTIGAAGPAVIVRKQAQSASAPAEAVTRNAEPSRKLLVPRQGRHDDGARRRKEQRRTRVAVTGVSCIFAPVWKKSDSPLPPLSNWTAAVRFRRRPRIGRRPSPRNQAEYRAARPAYPVPAPINLREGAEGEPVRRYLREHFFKLSGIEKKHGARCSPRSHGVEENYVVVRPSRQSSYEVFRVGVGEKDVPDRPQPRAPPRAVSRRHRPFGRHCRCRRMRFCQRLLPRGRRPGSLSYHLAEPADLLEGKHGPVGADVGVSDTAMSAFADSAFHVPLEGRYHVLILVAHFLEIDEHETEHDRRPADEDRRCSRAAFLRPVR